MSTSGHSIVLVQLDEGRRITRSLGFTEIYTSPYDGRSGYKLLTNDEESKLARFYMKGYAASIEARHTELRTPGTE